MKRGFSLVEVLVSAGLLLLVVVFGLNPLLKARASSDQTDKRLQALAVGRLLLDEFRTLAYEEVKETRGERDKVTYELRVLPREDRKELTLRLGWWERGRPKSLVLTAEVGEPL